MSAPSLGQIKRQAPNYAGTTRVRKGQHLAVVGLLLGMVWLLSGCGAWFQRGDQPLDIDFRPLLPQEWTPVGEWRTLSIDNDDTAEYLLFYAYESGQVGGVIYDPQADSGFAPVAGGTQAVVLPNQGGSVIMVPYRLLPNYWQGRGQGYLAEPGVEPTPIITRRTASEQGDTPDDQQMDELIVRGGNTHISIFWWQNQVEGYAVTYLSAPGGFYDFDWSGEIGNSTILSVDGYFPENDRSFFCQRVTYTRAIDPNSQVAGSRVRYRPTIGYTAKPKGLAFCKPNDEEGTANPEFTFYPEATVLSYLLYDQEQRQSVSDMANLVNIPGQILVSPDDERENLAQREQMVRTIDAAVGEFDRVHSLTYYPTLEIASSQQVTTEEQLKVHVIAELIDSVPDGGAASEDPALAGQSETLRRVNFTLQYQPPYLNPDNVDIRRWDRWLIVNAIAAD